MGFPNNSNAAWNGTGGIYSSGTVNEPANQAHLDPEGVGAILRYTAQVSGSYTVASTSTGEDSSQHQVFTSVFANGIQQGATNSISSYLGTQSYNFTVSLTAGQTLDFIVTGAGASFDSTGLSGTITSPSSATPEPATLSLLLLTIPGLAFLRRLRG